MIRNLLISGAVFSVGIAFASPAEIAICPKLTLTSPTSIEFSSEEKKYLCGDEESEAWSSLPAFQVKKTIEAILQSKGYYYPKFVERGEELHVQVGRQSKIQEITTSSDYIVRFNEELTSKRGTTLTPQVLDELETWTKLAFLAQGIPCPDLELKADPISGLVEVYATNARPLPLLEVEEDLSSGLPGGIMSRYFAFTKRSLFDGRLFEVTSNRIVSDGLADQSRFSIVCKDNGYIARQRLSTGPPRMITIGLGANTEKGPIAKLSWSATRLGARGSTLGATLLGSYRDQSFNLYSKWRVLEPSSRFYLRPEFLIKRTLESQYETIDAVASFFPGTTFDRDHFGGVVFWGPSLNYSHVVVGAGPETSIYFSLDASATLTSHLYEYFKNSPRTGWSIRLESSVIEKGYLSRVSGVLLRLEPRIHFNLAKNDPPSLILSLRGGLATTMTQTDNSSQTLLPVRYRHHLGGSEDLRGFGRKKIPPESAGALSAAYFGTELRSNSVLHEKLQPFLFFDIGSVGEQSLNLDLPLYYSPGIGTRWESPIGNFRGTLAHGFLNPADSNLKDNLSHWQGYLSYGQEF